MIYIINFSSFLTSKRCGFPDVQIEENIFLVAIFLNDGNLDVSPAKKKNLLTKKSIKIFKNLLTKKSIKNLKNLLKFNLLLKNLSITQRKIYFSKKKSINHFIWIKPTLVWNSCKQVTYNPLSPGVLLSVDLWDITQNKRLTSTDS